MARPVPRQGSIATRSIDRRAAHILALSSGLARHIL